MAFGIGDNRGQKDRSNRTQRPNNPVDSPQEKGRAGGEEDLSQRKGHVDSEDLNQVDTTQTPGGKKKTADLNLDE